MHNRIFIYNIIYVLIHILCYVVFITKMFEIKQNELCTHVCIIIRGRTSTALFYSRQANFWSKIILHFWTMCKYQKPLWYGGILHFKKICQCCQKGNVFHSHLPLNFQPPDPHPNSHPKYPIFVRELLRRTFEKSFISNNFQLPKNPQSHRITLKSHPKIIKSQIKPTHSRTKSNNPVITTKTHTTPPSHHTPNHHKNKAKTHINALTQYAKTSLL